MAGVARAKLANSQDASALVMTVFIVIHLAGRYEKRHTTKFTGQILAQEVQRLRLQNCQDIKDGAHVPDLEKLGVPHPSLWLAIAEASQQQGYEVGAQNAMCSRTYMDTGGWIATLLHSDIASQVKYRRVSYTHDKVTMKIFWQARQMSFKKEVVDGILQLEVSVKKGTPPMSPVEGHHLLSIDGREDQNI